MKIRTLASLASFAPVVLASAAYAQVPGDDEPAAAPSAPIAGPPPPPMVVPPPPPMVAPPPPPVMVIMAPGSAPAAPAPVLVDTGLVSPCLTRRSSVMENRWSLGLSVGSLGLRQEHMNDSRTDFVVGELALRFRATREFELELTAGGGQEPDSHDRDNDLRVNTVMLAARYHFLPEAQWNWFLTGGVGVAAISREHATDDERKDAAQALGMIGVGVERRFEHFALQAELRGIGLARRDDDHSDAALMTTSVSPTTTTVPAQSGASLTAGLSYYF